MSALPPKADIGTQSRDVRFVPILLQKSAMTGPSGWRELLELAAAHHSLNKGNGLTSTATELYTIYAKHALVTGGGRIRSFASLRRFCAIAASVNSN